MEIKKVISLAISVAITASLASCSVTSLNVEPINLEKKVHFSWWGKDLRINYTLESLATYESANPDIDIVPEYGEWTGFQNRMYVELASNTEADVMQINYDWLYKTSKDGNGFYDLNELSDYIDLDNFSKLQLEYGTMNNKLNGIPISLNTESLYYNQSLYYKYELTTPETWDDLFTAAEIMSVDGVYPLELPLKAMWLLNITHEEQLSGKTMIGENNQLEFTPENLESMLIFYKDLVDNKVTKTIEDIGKDDFSSGISAGTVYWISDAEYYCVPATENGYKIKVGDYLKINQSDNVHWYAKPTALYAISKDSAYPEDAAKFVNYLLNSSEMAEYQGLEKGVPLSKSTREYLEAEDKLTGIQYSANKKLTQNAIWIKNINPIMEDTSLINAFKNAFDEIYYNNANVTDVSNKLYQSFEKIISEY